MRQPYGEYTLRLNYVAAAIAVTIGIVIAAIIVVVITCRVRRARSPLGRPLPPKSAMPESDGKVPRKRLTGDAPPRVPGCWEAAKWKPPPDRGSTEARSSDLAECGSQAPPRHRGSPAPPIPIPPRRAAATDRAAATHSHPPPRKPPPEHRRRENRHRHRHQNGRSCIRDQHGGRGGLLKKATTLRKHHASSVILRFQGSTLSASDPQRSWSNSRRLLGSGRQIRRAAQPLPRSRPRVTPRSLRIRRRERRAFELKITEDASCYAK